MFNSKGRALGFLVRVAVFFLVFMALGEVWLRWVTPADQPPLPYQDTQSAVFRFDANGPASGLCTIGRLPRRAGRWRVNNAGWNSAIDYAAAAQRRRPAVALFGDSYIEGFLTSVDQHVDAYLPQLLPACDAYAFGLSGWYLEQYVAVSRYAASHFQPGLLVIFIDSGDVSDSVRENGVISDNLWQISGDQGRFEEVRPTQIYTASRNARLARRSAIVSYLRFNAGVALPGARSAAIAQPAPPADGAGGAAGVVSTEAWRRLLPPAAFMVGQLRADHPTTPILFVSDSQRYLPLAAVGTTPNFADALALQAACKGRPQFYFLDLRSAFSRDWSVHHRRFEAVDGAHWNAYANLLVARTLADFITNNRLLAGPSRR